MCNCDTSNGPSAFRSEQRRARKPHRCFECNKTIPVGAIYEYASGVWDERGDSFKTCLRCVGLREAHIKAEEMVQTKELEERWAEERKRSLVLMGSDSLPPPRYGWIEPCTVAFGTVIESIGECAREEKDYVRYFREARRVFLAADDDGGR